MNRRDVLAAGIGLATLATVDKASAVRPCPPTLSGTQPPECSQLPTSAHWDWNVPSLQDETDFYKNVMGWTIPAGAESFSDWRDSIGYFFGNLHNDTEGDDLWTWRHQLQRYGAATSTGGGNTVQDWYDDVLEEFKTNLVAELQADDNPSQPTGYGYDHLYGQGLAVVYNDTKDGTILPVLTSIRGLIESVPEYQELASGGTMTVQETSGRGQARWALVAAYAAEATQDPNWIAVRDNMARAYETSPDWEEGGVIVGGGGLFAAGRAQAAQSGGDPGSVNYDLGRRYTASFYIGLQSEAMWRMYLQTGSEILRERLIKMARYVQHYAHRPTWSYPSVGSRFGHEPDGTWWHKSGGDGTANNCAADPVYDISLINTMVIGYKLTRETAMLDFARTLFGRGNQYLPFPGQNYPLAAESTSHVYKYVDTISDGAGSIRTKFQWNKGQLQYCYQIFENGGNPIALV